ncbi:MAG: NACHT domain-containing protein [Terracidiphilus sp.]
MPLLETLVATVGPAIAKTLLKLWAGDNKLASEGGDSAIEVLTKLIPEIRARNETVRQLDAIGERAAESLMFTFEAEGKQLMVEDQEAVANLVARTLDHSRISTELLIQKDLDPAQLAQYLINDASDELTLLPKHRIDLFTRVIEEASQSIIDIARVLPSFTERTFAELLKRDRVLIDAAQRILENLDRIRAKTDDQDGSAAKFETEYRRATIRNLDKVELFGVDLSRSSRSQPLSVAYVSLNVGSDPELDVNEIRESEESDGEASAIEVVEAALARHRMLLLRGPAGAGKTTLLQWVAVRAASRSFEEPLENWNVALPFLIRLRQFGDSALPRPEDFPSLIAPTISGTMPSGWAHDRLKSGAAIVLVDGVDEVAESRRDEVRKWIIDIVSTFSACCFIVTSRPHAVEQSWLKNEGFHDADLQPMDTPGIEVFIDHWHRAVAEEARREEDLELLCRLAAHLKTTLRGNQAVRRLATSPLLCGVICALHRDTNEQLPQDRIELYERCCSMLLERRDSESGLHFRDYPKLSYRQKRALLDDLAYWMIKNEWSEISLDSVRSRFNKKIDTFRPDLKDGAVLTGQNAARFFLERSGILREPVKGKVDFAHRTFQEYMAANAALSEADIGMLISHASHPQWREVVVLGAGIARQKERTQLIQSLIQEGDRKPNIAPQLFLLAAACLDVSIDVENVLRAEVARRIGTLFPPKTVSDAMEIAQAAGEMAIPYLRWGSRYTNTKQAAASVRALAVIGTRESIQAIAEYADHYSSFAVPKEVVRASDRIESHLFLELIAPRLRVQDLPGESVSLLIERFGFDQICNLETATDLTVWGSRARDLSILRKLPELRSLRISGPEVQDLTPLNDLIKLERLTFEKIPVLRLAGITFPSTLEYLEVKRCSIDATELARIRSLKMLSINYSHVLNSRELTSAHNLRRIFIYNSEIDFTFLIGMNKLVHLSLVEAQQDALSVLNDLHHLKSLVIIGGDLGELRKLDGLTSLEELDLFQVRISDSATLPSLPRLKKLSLKGAGISPKLTREAYRKYPEVKITT